MPFDPPHWPVEGLGRGDIIRARLLRVLLPGLLKTIGEQRPGRTVLDADGLAKLVVSRRISGFGDAYVEGMWRPTDVDLSLDRFAVAFRRLLSILDRMRLVSPYDHAQRRGSGRVRDLDSVLADISWHYDLPVEFFQSFLDPSLAYSAAWFEREEMPLVDAQMAKFVRAGAELGLASGSSVLEIGSGWGTAARMLAKQGLAVDSYSASKEQVEYSRAVARADSSGPNFVLGDFSQIHGKYDGALSIEMIEAVGGARIGEYFDKVASVLKPDARFVVQFIYMSPVHRRWSTSSTWTQRYIFPGGEILTDELVTNAAARAGFVEVNRLELGRDYARTLSLWLREFRKSTGTVRKLGATARFIRMWEYYLVLSLSGFRSGLLSCDQVTFELRSNS